MSDVDTINAWDPRLTAAGDLTADEGELLAKNNAYTITTLAMGVLGWEFLATLSSDYALLRYERLSYPTLLHLTCKFSSILALVLAVVLDIIYDATVSFCHSTQLAVPILCALTYSSGISLLLLRLWGIYARPPSLALLFTTLCVTGAATHFYAITAFRSVPFASIPNMGFFSPGCQLLAVTQLNLVALCIWTGVLLLAAVLVTARIAWLWRRSDRSLGLGRALVGDHVHIYLLLLLLHAANLGFLSLSTLQLSIYYRRILAAPALAALAIGSGRVYRSGRIWLELRYASKSDTDGADPDGSRRRDAEGDQTQVALDAMITSKSSHLFAPKRPQGRKFDTTKAAAVGAPSFSDATKAAEADGYTVRRPFKSFRSGKQRRRTASGATESPLALVPLPLSPPSPSFGQAQWTEKQRGSSGEEQDDDDGASFVPPPYYLPRHPPPAAAAAATAPFAAPLSGPNSPRAMGLPTLYPSDASGDAALAAAASPTGALFRQHRFAFANIEARARARMAEAEAEARAQQLLADSGEAQSDEADAEQRSSEGSQPPSPPVLQSSPESNVGADADEDEKQELEAAAACALIYTQTIAPDSSRSSVHCQGRWRSSDLTAIASPVSPVPSPHSPNTPPETDEPRRQMQLSRGNRDGDGGLVGWAM